jgi:hypothetical protein
VVGRLFGQKCKICSNLQAVVEEKLMKRSDAAFSGLFLFIYVVLEASEITMVRHSLHLFPMHNCNLFIIISEA